MKRVILASVLITILLVGCSNKPKDVSQEFWDNAIQTTLYIDNSTKSNESIETDNINSLLGKDVADMTDAENEIYKEILQLQVTSLLVGIANLTGETEGTAFEDYSEQYNKLEKRFGNANLRSGNYDEDKIVKTVAASNEEESIAIEDRRYSFMNQRDVNLTAKEVQYNMSNHIGEQFYLEGTVEICDYYNYGFTNEKDLFCAKLTPFDGGYSDSWYLYFGRDSFAALYDHLVNYGTFDLMVIAEIPNRTYKKGQGNMARVKSSQGYKP
ncbi:hypothetical protein [Sporosarcina aquimarina]|uniref:hypothetical protein n=1 Tax=Sporosarcina aquimarina TaxID=114975 RepID=UPI001C8E5F54|nr:hypothetical protein [Sporosarcina aquimarina]MBY0221955.1 hypothetical protein [Sporosarcina aquimarina]